MGKSIGYTRVSTDDQDTVQQRDALVRAGCVEVFDDPGVSGFFVPARDRAGFKAALAALEPGDTLVVWRLDRVGRSVVDLILTITELGERGIAFRSLCDSIDTTTATGKAMFGMLAVFAQLYRDQISENTRLAMAAIKEGRRTQKPGKKRIGRPNALSEDDIRMAQMLLAAGATKAEVAAQLGTNKVTLWRTFKRAGIAA